MKLYFTLLLCLFAANTMASMKLVTSSGDVVILNDDKTWRYENETLKFDETILKSNDVASTPQSNSLKANNTAVKKTDNKADEGVKLVLNPASFNKYRKAKFNLKSKETNAIFAIDTKKWKFSKNENSNAPAEYTFKLKKGALFGVAISEPEKVDAEKLAENAFENLKRVAPDTKIIRKEYRIVNDTKVIYMEMTGTLHNVKIKYLGYYYSNASGSTQYVAYTGVGLVNKYKSDIDNFLNGLSVKK